MDANAVVFLFALSMMVPKSLDVPRVHSKIQFFVLAVLVKPNPKIVNHYCTPGSSSSPNTGRMSDKIRAEQKIRSCSVITSDALEVTPSDLSRLAARARRFCKISILSTGNPLGPETRSDFAIASAAPWAVSS